jgi:hypothetical protein
MKRQIGCIRAFLLIVLSSLACGPVSSQSALPSSLVVVPGATDVRQSKEFDGRIDYTVDDPFPASIVIRGLDQAMKSQGWSSLDFVVPPQPSETKLRE